MTTNSEDLAVVRLLRVVSPIIGWAAVMFAISRGYCHCHLQQFSWHVLVVKTVEENLASLSQYMDWIGGKSHELALQEY